jgi:glycosyltransferase involved in cell wall biosynthesis
MGDGSEREALQGQAERLGISRLLRWHGSVAGADRWFAAFDTFVLSSRTEGTPLVLLEAMAAGVPIVATAVGGVPSVVSNAEAALIPPQNPDALAVAIRNIFRDREEAAARAARATRRLAERFAIAPWIERHDAIYREARNGENFRVLR